MKTAAVYTVDIVLDVLLAIGFHASGKMLYFWYTLAFVVLQPLCTVFSNVRDYWYPRRSSSTVVKPGGQLLAEVMCTVVYPLAVYLR